MRLRYYRKDGHVYCWDPDEPMLSFDASNPVPQMACILGYGETIDSAVGSAVRNLTALGRCVIVEDVEELCVLPTKPEPVKVTLAPVDDADPRPKPSIEDYIPEGYEFVRFGNVNSGEEYLDGSGGVQVHKNSRTGPTVYGRVIVRPKPRQAYSVTLTQVVKVDAKSVLDAAMRASMVAQTSSESTEYSVQQVGSPGVPVLVKWADIHVGAAGLGTKP